MTKSLLFVAASVLALSASAAIGREPLPRTAPESIALQSDRHRAPSKVPTTVIPGETPEGIERFYTVKAISQVPGNYGTMQAETDCVKKVIFSEDGKTVWFQNMQYGVPGDYIMGTIDGNRIVCEFPQLYVHQLQKDSQGNEAHVYFNLMALDYTVEVGRDDYGQIVNFYDFSISEEQTVEFEYNPETGDITELSTLGIGTVVVMYDEDDNEVPQFINYADLDFEMTWEKDFYVPEIPDDLEYENYIFEFVNDRDRSRRHYVNVAERGDFVFIQGLSEFMPEAVVCLQKEEDGEDYFIPMGEYLGYSLGNQIMAYTGRYVGNEGDFEPTDVMKFKVDHEAKTINFVSSADFLAYNTSLDELYYVDFFNMPQLAQCEQPAFATPTPPYEMWYIDDYFEWGLGYQLIFFVSPESTEGELLSTKRLYFQLHIDGEPYLLEPEEYRNLLEPMDLVPFDFTEDRDINDFAGVERYDISFYCDGFRTCGIQIWYENADGTFSGSDVATYDLAKAEMTEADMEGAEYYDLTGRRLDRPAPGICIVRKDGKTSKMMVR